MGAPALSWVATATTQQCSRALGMQTAWSQVGAWHCRRGDGSRRLRIPARSPPSSSDLEVSGHSIAHELACRRPLAVMSRRALRPAILPPRSALGSNTRKHPIAHPHVQGDSRRRPATSIATTFVGLASGGAVTAAYMSEGARAGKCAVAQEERRWRRLLLSACEFFHEDRGATQ